MVCVVYRHVCIYAVCARELRGWRRQGWRWWRRGEEEQQQSRGPGGPRIRPVQTETPIHTVCRGHHPHHPINLTPLTPLTLIPYYPNLKSIIFIPAPAPAIHGSCLRLKKERRTGVALGRVSERSLSLSLHREHPWPRGRFTLLAHSAT